MTNAPTEGAVKALQSNKFQNSWGGTRTRDPGIMREAAGPRWPAATGFGALPYPTDSQGNPWCMAQNRIQDGWEEECARPNAHGRVSDASRAMWGHTGNQGYARGTVR